MNSRQQGTRTKFLAHEVSGRFKPKTSTKGKFLDEIELSHANKDGKWRYQIDEQRSRVAAFSRPESKDLFTSSIQTNNLGLQSRCDHRRYDRNGSCHRNNDHLHLTFNNHTMEHPFYAPYGTRISNGGSYVPLNQKEDSGDYFSSNGLVSTSVKGSFYNSNNIRSPMPMPGSSFQKRFQPRYQNRRSVQSYNYSYRGCDQGASRCQKCNQYFDQSMTKHTLSSQCKHRQEKIPSTISLKKTVGVQTSIVSLKANEQIRLENGEESFIDSISYEDSFASERVGVIAHNMSSCSSVGSIPSTLFKDQEKLSLEPVSPNLLKIFDPDNAEKFSPNKPKIDISSPDIKSLSSEVQPIFEHQYCIPIVSSQEQSLSNGNEFLDMISSNSTKSSSSKKRTRRACNVIGCSNRVVQGGLCIKHGAKRKKCNYPGCTKHVKKAGRCSTHGPPRKRCLREGCKNVAVQGGKCISHGASKKKTKF